MTRMTDWAFIDFPDNQDCLDLIQNRILAMLKDERRLPKGIDRNWANRLFKMHLGSEKKQAMVEGEEEPRFIASAIQKSNTQVSKPSPHTCQSICSEVSYRSYRRGLPSCLFIHCGKVNQIEEGVYMIKLGLHQYKALFLFNLLVSSNHFLNIETMI